ncbi:pseudouridine synthase [Thioclava atlantica]|uniref:Pseudouridine synthase n=1 Tax=Thioclava atlantica TaxID=1317124 RepID=A0A085TYU4_9RHOB|nr:pseudouridine synthase [Thioclava atlantica]KFE35891.1 ribosomal large subunit pseudouridine synthase B [Thioclava atlantica]
MTDTPAPKPVQTERVAKVIARSGVASRRDAEKMIFAGKVAVNGKQIDTPARDVAPGDKITIDGKPIDAPQETRLWLYYKPLGLVTTEKDELGRRTIFDEMPEGMPRVLNIGRLDLNSEGLLLLTNDGGLKRRLELPETGWLRKYRVRVNGRPTEATFDPLRRGITIEGEEFLPMEVTLDRQQGANAWLTVGIREGRNREIRRAMTEIGLQVNRLIRISYGPFRLMDMNPGDVMEVKRRMLRDQLGGLLEEAPQQGEPERHDRKPRRDGDARPERGPRGEKPRFGKREDGPREDRPRKPRAGGVKSHRDEGDKPRFNRDRDDRGRDDKPRFNRDRDDRGREDKPRFDKKRDDRPQGDRPRFSRDRDDRDQGGKPRFAKPRTDGPRDGAPRKPRSGGFKSNRDGDDKPRFSRDRDDRPQGDKPRFRKDRDDRPQGDRPRFNRDRDDRDQGDKPRFGKPRGDRPEGDRPRSEGFRSRGDKPGGKPRAEGFKSHGGKPGGKPRAGGFKSHRDGDDKRGGRGPGNGPKGAPRGKPRG